MTARATPRVGAGARRSRADGREQLERRILVELESAQLVTQRSLAAQLGIALGLTNLLMRRLVKKRWVHVKRVYPRRVRYQITPAGMIAKARLSRQYLLATLGFYRECRDRIHERLTAASAALTHGGDASQDGYGVVFFGAGEVAEVAYVCLQETQLALVGVVDPVVTKRFFHLPVLHPSALSADSLGGSRFALVIVMPSQNEEQVLAALTEQNVPPERVFWL